MVAARVRPERAGRSRTAIQVFDAKGRLVSGRAALAGRRPARRRGAAPPLPRGGYTVRWATISNDGHVGRGVFTFGVRAAAPAIARRTAPPGRDRPEHVVRWLYFLCLALADRRARLPAARAARRGDRPRPSGASTASTGVGVVGALQVGIVAFLLRAEDALQLPFTAFLYGDLSPFAHATRFGQAFVVMELGFALVAALLFLAWLTERRVLLWAAFLLSLGLGSGLSLSSHQSDDRGWLPSFADWVHLSAATLWIGGLLSLGLVVWNDRELRRTAFWRFSEIAGPLVALVVAAGVYMTFKRFPALDDLWSVGYGQLLLVKLALVCARALVGRVPPLRRPAAARPAGRRGGCSRRASPARRRSRSRSCCWRRSWSTRSRLRSRRRRRPPPSSRDVSGGLADALSAAAGSPSAGPREPR